MTDMEELNLYGTKVTNAGLDVLCGMKHLITVDLRYTRVTRAGVDRLRTAVPQANVSFLDTSVRTTVPPDTDKIVASEGDMAVAQWVRSVGGRAVVDHGKLIAVSLAVTSVSDELLLEPQRIETFAQTGGAVDRHRRSRHSSPVAIDRACRSST